MLFWTKEEYLKFAETMMDKPMSYYAFEMLYWRGIWEGELLALTPTNFDSKAQTVSITKSYQHIKWQDMITTPKAPKSNRVIKMSLSSLSATFRVSPEEDAQIEPAVKLTGFTKQDYITQRLLNREVVVQGNLRVYKALRDLLDELRRIEAGAEADSDLLDTINMIAAMWAV